MAKIIAFGEFANRFKQKQFEENLQKEIENVEVKLNLEDPLLVLTDDITITLANNLIDIRDSINRALEILGVSESSPEDWDL